jgi:decaprenylphospho-beta-D-erythro-pentofuranosid-2-ulose 2-reductase
MRDALGSVQSALVLGGGSDIAQAIAHALVAQRTRRLVLAGRAPERLEPVAEDLRRAGAESVEVVAFDADATDAHAAFVEDVFDRHGDLDLVLLAFGVLGDQAEAEREPSAAVAVSHTNYVGAVSVLLPVAHRLKRQGHGTIVVLSSVAAERARRANFVYGASKAGLDAFCQGLGDSLHGSGVDVMVVRPGFVRTQMTEGLEPAPFATDADAVARAVLHGLRRRAHTVWAPPALRWVMAAMRQLPRPLFRRIADR